ncbi:unnamed protein product, partial [Rotaria magnacalcarata]
MSTNKLPLNNNNSEKQPVRPSSVTSSSKVTEKKSSDTPNSATAAAAATTKPSTESNSAKPSPVTLGKIPKLNPANKQKSIEKAMSSKSLTDQKSDILAPGNTLTNNNNGSNLSEKNVSNMHKSPAKQRSPSRSSRPAPTHPMDNVNSFAPLSPIRLDDNIVGKQTSVSNQRYPPLLDNDIRSTSNFPRVVSIGIEHSQSQSPLSPDPSSTLYPPPSPPSLPLAPPPPLLSSRSISSSAKSFIDSRPSQSNVLG